MGETPWFDDPLVEAVSSVERGPRMGPPFVTASLANDEEDWNDDENEDEDEEYDEEDDDDDDEFDEEDDDDYDEEDYDEEDDEEEEED